MRYDLWKSALVTMPEVRNYDGSLIPRLVCSQWTSKKAKCTTPNFLFERNAFKSNHRQPIKVGP